MVVYDRRLRHVEFFVKTLDNRFTVLGKGIGLDPFFDFIPYVGPFIGLLLSFYIIWIAIMNNVSRSVILKMLILVAFDYFLGLIPFMGIVADAVFHANSRNLKMLKKELGIEGNL